MQPSTQELQAAGKRALSDPSLRHVIGVDEVGYGAWAGPVVVCAVVTLVSWQDPRVRDSKELKHHQRAELVREVLHPPDVLFEYIAMRDNREIDASNVTRARDDAVRDAVQGCLAVYPKALVVMDGNQLPSKLKARAVCFPKADSLVTAVSAASILAKECRDEIMRSYHKMYPHYRFITNMGYGTREHEQGLEAEGPCPIHRMSYQNLKKYLK